MRAIIIVLDSVGIGELPDAADYGDAGSNTLENIARQRSLSLPNMTALGLGNIDGVRVLEKTRAPQGAFGKLAEQSKGKDTTTGHWEIAGLVTSVAFPTYPNGFPSDVIFGFEQIAGRKVIGNCTASGTQIIQSLGEEHCKTGNLIVYTSADSVFQIAAHEDVVPVQTLYRICEETRAFLRAPHNISRVIARPFVGANGQYTRTENRKDFSVPPPGDTLLTLIENAGQQVAAVGKIEDIFAMQGITQSVHTHNNEEGITQTLAFLDSVTDGLIFTNLVDYDMLYGHRNDVKGYAAALEYFDKRLPEIINGLREDDLLFITADHGCDPTTESTDHSREYVPLLLVGKQIKKGVNLHIRSSFSDIAATIQEYLGVSGAIAGESFLPQII